MTSPWEHTRQDGLYLPIFTASLVGMALLLLRQATYGLHWNYDGLFYVSAAANVLAGEGFLTFNGTRLTAWPPLFSLALATASGFGIFNPTTIVAPFNIATFGLTIFIVGSYLRQRIESRPLVVWACFAVALSTPLATLASKPRAEPLFVLLTTLALIQTHRLLTHGGKTALLLAATFTALAWQTRYLGVALPAVVGLFLLVQPGPSWPAKAWRLAIYSAIVVLPMGLWLLRNKMLVGAGLEPWGISNPTLFPSEAINVILGWLDFNLPLTTEPDTLTPYLNIGIPLAVATTGILVAWTRQCGRGTFDWSPCWLFGGFAIAYCAALSVAQTLGYWDVVFENRFIAPLWIPILIALTFAFDGLIGWASDKRGHPSVDGSTYPQTRLKSPLLPKLFIGTLSTTLALWTVDQIMQNAREVRQLNSYTDLQINESDLAWVNTSHRHAWASSDTLRYIRQNPLRSDLIFTNVPTHLYINNAAKPKKYVYIRWDRPPHMSDLRLGNAVARLAKEGNGTYIVLFRLVDPYMYETIAKWAKITPGLAQVASLADGAIFQVERGHVPPNPYREALRLIVTGRLGNPSASWTFDVYRNGRTLTYFKWPCLPEDTEKPFFLSFTTTVAQFPSGVTNAVPACLGEGERHVDGRFHFLHNGMTLNGDTCVAIAELPKDVPICRMSTGQSANHIGWTVRPNVADLRTMPSGSSPNQHGG